MQDAPGAVQSTRQSRRPSGMSAQAVLSGQGRTPSQVALQLPRAPRSTQLPVAQLASASSPVASRQVAPMSPRAPIGRQPRVQVPGPATPAPARVSHRNPGTQSALVWHPATHQGRRAVPPPSAGGARASAAQTAPASQATLSQGVEQRPRRKAGLQPVPGAQAQRRPFAHWRSRSQGWPAARGSTTTTALLSTVLAFPKDPPGRRRSCRAGGSRAGGRNRWRTACRRRTSK